MPKANAPHTWRTPTVDLFSVPLQRDDEDIGAPPRLRIPLLPEGTFSHPSYGELEWTPEKLGVMIANFNRGATGFRPMLNADHSTHNPFAVNSPAYGWAESLEWEPGKGLFAVVQLTDLGEEAVEKKRYRYISAEVCDTYERETGESFEHVILGMALTNVPFHATMPGLFSARPAEDADLLAQFTRDLQAYATAAGDLSFEDVRAAVHKALIVEWNDGSWDTYPCLCEVFPSFCIYKVGDYDAKTSWKRDYTLTDGKVFLSDEKVEVELVWVEKARQAFAAARMGALRLRSPRGPAGLKAGLPARGGRMTVLEKVRRFFGLAETATEEEIEAAMEAQAAETADPPDSDVQEELARPADTAVTALAGEVAELKALTARLRDEAEAAKKQAGEANLSLARKAAADAVAAYERKGVITPAQREDAIEFALESPARFKAIYDAAKPQVPLTTSTHLRLADESGPDDFMALVGQKLATAGMEFNAAVELAARERPELYDQYRRRTTAGGRAS